MSETYEPTIKRISNGYLMNWGVAGTQYIKTVDEIMVIIKREVEKLV